MNRVVVLLLLASGCADSTTVTVSVVSNTVSTLRALAAHVEVADGSAAREVAFTTTPVQLPTRFRVELSAKATLVTVTLDGSDNAGLPVHVAEAVYSVPHQDVALNFWIDGDGGPGGDGYEGPPDGGSFIGPGPDGGIPELDGGSVSDGGTVSDGGSNPCAAPAILCNGVCVDPTSDPNNCMGCGSVCASGYCGVTLSAPMTSGHAPSTWSFNRGVNSAGGAFYDTNTSVAVITADSNDYTSSLIHRHPIITDGFDATFDFRISAAGSTHADGMTFVMLKDNGSANMATTIGIGGSGLAIAGATAGSGGPAVSGYAVELDTYDNDTVRGACGESINGDHVNVDTLDSCVTGGGRVPSPLASPRAFTLVDGNWHTAHVTLLNGRMSVSITDGSGTSVALFSDVVLTGFNPGDVYYFGFSGATGGFSERAEVENIAITFPTSRCL